jgi:transglutaminase-like putative cysteine protease
VRDVPGDFSAWFEVYLGGHWHTFDARHNQRRIGRILMARGRDATDVAIATTFGPCTLAGFRVITDEIAPSPANGWAAPQYGNAPDGPAAIGQALG